MGTRRIAVSKDWLRKRVSEATALARASGTCRPMVKEEMPFIPIDAEVGEVQARDNQNVVIISVHHPSFKAHGTEGALSVQPWEVPENFSGACR